MPDSAPALARSVSVPGLRGRAVANKATVCLWMKSQKTKLGRTMVPPCPAQAEDKHPNGLGFSLGPGMAK